MRVIVAEDGKRWWQFWKEDQPQEPEEPQVPEEQDSSDFKTMKELQEFLRDYEPFKRIVPHARNDINATLKAAFMVMDDLQGKTVAGEPITHGMMEDQINNLDVRARNEIGFDWPDDHPLAWCSHSKKVEWDLFEGMTPEGTVQEGTWSGGTWTPDPALTPEASNWVRRNCKFASWGGKP
jgi:hypothetical protein